MTFPNKEFYTNFKKTDGSVGGLVKKEPIPNNMGYQTPTNTNKPSPKKPGVVLS